jgi:hypothetical protein
MNMNYFRFTSRNPISFQCVGDNINDADLYASFKATNEIEFGEENLQLLKQSFNTSGFNEEVNINWLKLHGETVECEVLIRGRNFSYSFANEMTIKNASTADLPELFKVFGVKQFVDSAEKINLSKEELQNRRFSFENEIFCLPTAPITVVPKPGDLGDVIGVMMDIMGAFANAANGNGNECNIM